MTGLARRWTFREFPSVSRALAWRSPAAEILTGATVAFLFGVWWFKMGITLCLSKDPITFLDSMPGPRIIKSHLSVDFLPPAVGKVKQTRQIFSRSLCDEILKAPLHCRPVSWSTWQDIPMTPWSPTSSSSRAFPPGGSVAASKTLLFTFSRKVF